MFDYENLLVIEVVIEMLFDYENLLV